MASCWILRTEWVPRAFKWSISVLDPSQRTLRFTFMDVRFMKAYSFASCSKVNTGHRETLCPLWNTMEVHVAHIWLLRRVFRNNVKQKLFGQPEACTEASLFFKYFENPAGTVLRESTRLDRGLTLSRGSFPINDFL